MFVTLPGSESHNEIVLGNPIGVMSFCSGIPIHHLHIPGRCMHRVVPMKDRVEVIIYVLVALHAYKNLP